jgi:glycosyltransferase involved in cell wall biosynthesis
MVEENRGEMISVIIRFHDETKMDVLDQALFSLATQSYLQLQMILVVQNGSPALIARLEELILKQPFPPQPDNAAAGKHLIVPVMVEEGIDGRTVLLNTGIAHAEGRFLAFLDYDDVIYHDAYRMLIAQLEQSKAALAVGGCRKAHQRVLEEGGYFIEKKEPYVGSMRSKFDLIADNFIPIHSYVIDRSVIDAADLQFNTRLSCLEDYAFLLTLVVKYRFDFSLLLAPVAEYRLRTDGSNTVDLYSDSEAKNQQWEQARAYVATMRESLSLDVSAEEIGSLINETIKLKDQNYYLGSEVQFYVKEFTYYKNEYEFYKREFEYYKNESLFYQQQCEHHKQTLNHKIYKAAAMLQAVLQKYTLLAVLGKYAIRPLHYLRRR